MLLYCHYDVQPPLGEDAWDVPVFELTEKDGRWYGRGSADCKGNVVMHLTALRALHEVNGGFPCGIKLICEGSEEQGTGGLEAFVPDNVELLRADTISSSTPETSPSASHAHHDAARHDDVDVTLEALGSPMHSGMFGGPAPDPWLGLIQMLATLHDDAGNTTVDGLTTPDVDRRRVPVEEFRADANVLDGVELMGDGPGRHAVGAAVRDGARGRLPPVIGSSAAIQARPPRASACGCRTA